EARKRLLSAAGDSLPKEDVMVRRAQDRDLAEGDAVDGQIDDFTRWQTANRREDVAFREAQARETRLWRIGDAILVTAGLLWLVTWGDAVLVLLRNLCGLLGERIK